MKIKANNLVVDTCDIEIGLSSACNILIVGHINIFLTFFHAVKTIVNWHEYAAPHDDYLIIDRLYKRYVRENELIRTRKCMNFIYDQITAKTKDVNVVDATKKMCDIFFRSFDNTTDFKRDESIYVPIIIVITNLPYCIIDQERSLEKLDTWDGPPFWTRFYLKELVDQGKPLPELPF